MGGGLDSAARKKPGGAPGIFDRYLGRAFRDAGKRHGLPDANSARGRRNRARKAAVTALFAGVSDEREYWKRGHARRESSEYDHRTSLRDCLPEVFEGDGRHGYRWFDYPIYYPSRRV